MRLHPFCVIYFCGIEKEIMINDWRRGGRRRRRQREEGIARANICWCWERNKCLISGCFNEIVFFDVFHMVIINLLYCTRIKFLGVLWKTGEFKWMPLLSCSCQHLGQLWLVNLCTVQWLWSTFNTEAPLSFGIEVILVQNCCSPCGQVNLGVMENRMLSLSDCARMSQ